MIKVGDKVIIKNIEGLPEVPGILEYVKTPFTVRAVQDNMSDEFVGIRLEGVPFLMTDKDVEIVNED